MKFKSLILVVGASLGFVACDDNTGTLGSSLTNNMDHLEITTDTFELTSRSIVVDSVFARNTNSYLGTVRDPETGEYFTANFMTQFHTLENNAFPKQDSIVSRDANGLVQVDSCEIRMFFSKFYGDSLVSMKCRINELSRPMSEAEKYYSNFDPKAAGMIRTNGLKATKTYSLTDMNVVRNTRDDSNYSKNIKVDMNEPYTDKDGVTYNNYGTYIMRKYYENPENFSTSIRMTNHVIPGVYVESTNGIGCVAYIRLAQINTYYRYHKDSSDSVYVGTSSFSGTQEVMQHTNFANDKKEIKAIAADNTCTYLKTPAGIFTEVTIPVEKICEEHENDTINSASFTIKRINNTVQSKYAYDVPQTVMLIPEDSLICFFENKDIVDNETSYLATYSSAKNTYTFNNIGELVREMQKAKQQGETSENWNKVVLIPVTTTTNSSGYIVKVVHDMSLTGTKLVGGSANPYEKLKISVIYSKYK